MPEVRGVEQNDALCSALEELRGSPILIEGNRQLLVLYQVGREGAIQRVLYCKPGSAAFEEEDRRTKPRYTVELTTEGWQIKDNEKGTFTADVFKTRELAEGNADTRSRIDKAEG